MPASKRSTVTSSRRTAPAKRQVTPVSRFGGRFRFISDIIAELKKVTWLTRREAVYLTGLVLLVAVSVGIVLGLLDLGLTELVNKLLLGG